MADRLVALPGCLIGSWRGISFHIPDISTEAGRRIVAIELPGLDVTLHEDLGLHDGQIRVTGLIVGDDIGGDAAALQAACETKGPGTLVHPWLGAMTVVLTQPADIRFQVGALRTCTFQATFAPWSGSVETTGGLATLAEIAVAVEGIGAVVTDVVDLVIDLLDASEILTTVFDLIETVIDVSIAGADLVAIVAAAGVEAAIDTVADAAAMVVWIEDLVGVIAGAGVPPRSPAIGVGPLGRSTEANIDPWTAVETLLAVATASAAASLEADDEGTSLVEVSVAVAALAAATDPLAAVDWESKQQALWARATISTAIAVVARAAIGAATATGETASSRRATWRALGNLRRTIHQDLDDRIGRLPSVMRVTAPARVSAWIVAQHLFGDDPKAVRAGFEDIVRRNRLAHPSICDVDPIEVLPQ